MIARFLWFLLTRQVRDPRIEEMLANVPLDSGAVVILHSTADGWAGQWRGMPADECAMALYRVADEIVEQRVPLPASMTQH